MWWGASQDSHWSCHDFLCLLTSCENAHFVLCVFARSKLLLRCLCFYLGNSLLQDGIPNVWKVGETGSEAEGALLGGPSRWDEMERWDEIYQVSMMWGWASDGKWYVIKRKGVWGLTECDIVRWSVIITIINHLILYLLPLYLNQSCLILSVCLKTVFALETSLHLFSTVACYAKKDFVRHFCWYLCNQIWCGMQNIVRMPTSISFPSFPHVPHKMCLTKISDHSSDHCQNDSRQIVCSRWMCIFVRT